MPMTIPERRQVPPGAKAYVQAVGFFYDSQLHWIKLTIRDDASGFLGSARFYISEAKYVEWRDYFDHFGRFDRTDSHAESVIRTTFPDLVWRGKLPDYCD